MKERSAERKFKNLDKVLQQKTAILAIFLVYQKKKIYFEPSESNCSIDFLLFFGGVLCLFVSLLICFNDNNSEEVEEKKLFKINSLKVKIEIVF